MIIPAEANAERVRGTATGRNQLPEEPKKSITKSAARTVRINPANKTKIRLCAKRNNVEVIHAPIINTSAMRDHPNPFRIIRSTRVQTAIAEKAIIPLSSQMDFLISFLCT